MPVEKTIHAHDLLDQLEEVLLDISKNNVVYIVKNAEKNWSGDNGFILGPYPICGNVLGLIDEEYGWPTMVDYQRIKSVEDITPAYKKHPFVYSGTKCVAVGIQLTEYSLIKEKLNLS